MAIRMRYDLDLDAAIKGIGTLEKRAEDMTPLMEQIGSLLVTSAERRIRETNEGPDGVPWKPSLRSMEQGGPTLVETGRLLDSFSVDHAHDHVVVGTPLPYAGIHQTGGTITARNADALHFALPNGQIVQVGSVEIPARPFLGISEDDEEGMLDMVNLYFDFAD